MTIGRTFLLWLLGVLIVTLVLVSALVLWDEQRALEGELENQSRLLAKTLALTVAEGGSPEYLRVISTGDLRAGEVRAPDGQVLWRYGPPLDEALALDMSLLRVDEAVEVGRGPWQGSDAVEVVLLVSRSRIDRQFAGSAVRLVTALGLTLALALVAGLSLVARVVGPLRALADGVRAFDAERPPKLRAVSTSIREVRELGEAFDDMTQRLAEQRRSLTASERRYRELFAASPSPLLELDEGLVIRGANAAAMGFLGCVPEAAAGRSVTRYVTGIPEDQLASGLVSAYLAEEAVIEARWRLPGGEEAEVELHVRPAGDDHSPGLLMAIHDLTDRVRRLGERWRQTFDAMVDGVALVDGSGEIVLANRALQLHLPAIRPGLPARLMSPEAGWRVLSGGRLLDCSLSMPEGLGSFILVARDVTDAARAEARLREADKMQAVGTLASGVAHDFNNLLAAILLHVRWLERDPAAAAEAGAAIRELADEGTEVVRELLLFARRESTPPRTLDLGAMVAAQESVLRHLVPESVELRLELPDRVVPVVGNPVALRRALLNLVVNAGDAVPAAGGWVKVALLAQGGRAVLEVSDNGPGVPEEYRGRVFEPFFSSRRHGRGAGLGLAVVYAIVTEHGGEIELEEGAGPGARFLVRLPLGRESDVEPLPAASHEAGGMPPAARVMLVDDDGREATRIVEALAGAGLEIRHATSLAAAAALVGQWAPAAAVAVAELPDGAVAPWLQRWELPAVVLSSGRGDLALPPTTLVVERGVAPEAVLAALQRLGVAILARS
ncbi:MAG TPA: ATP-binding protein [Thermoanaerobaculales bacterium]|nr:ATP-binding protein [Thermoanaerobaculales bacterium]